MVVVANVLVAVGGETQRCRLSSFPVRLLVPSSAVWASLASEGLPVEMNVKLVSPFLHCLPALSAGDGPLISRSQMFSAATALFVVVAPVWRREINNRHVSESVTT